MKQIIFLLMYLFTLNTFGQEKKEETSPDSKEKKFQIGVMASVDWCYRKLENNDANPRLDRIIILRDDNERYKIGYTSGISLCYAINHSFGIESGIQYSNKGYQTNTTSLLYGRIPTSSNYEQKYIYNMYYLDFPLKVNFSAGRNRLRILGSIGAVTNIFIKETIVNVYEYNGKKGKEKETRSNLQEYNKLNITPFVSAGVDYKINKQFNLRIEPTVKYGLLKITKTPITSFLYNAGLNVSCFFAI